MVVGVNAASNHRSGLRTHDKPSARVLDALEAARGTPLLRGAVDALGERLVDLALDELEAAAEAAVEAYEFEAAAALLLAATTRGRRPHADDLEPILPFVDDLTLEALVAAATGDRVDLLVHVAGSRRLDAQGSALALMLATALAADADDDDRPPELVTELRLLAREELDEETGDMVATCAKALKDEALLAVAAPWIQALDQAGEAPFDLVALRRRMNGPPLDLLPEDDTTEVIEGDGAPLKAHEKVGRNDPCPCGSGKKFKKCCEGKQAARPAASAPQAAGAGEGAREKVPLSPRELLALDPASVEATSELVELYQSSVELQLWPVAERLVDELVARELREATAAVAEGGDHGLLLMPTRWHLELMTSALVAGEADVVHGQLSKLDGVLRESPELRVVPALVEPRPDALDRLEAAARALLEDEDEKRADDDDDAEVDDPGLPSPLSELALRVASRYPALGLLLARGVAFEENSAERPADRAWVLDELERLRDRLLLAPGDPYQDVFDALVRDHDARQKAAEAAKAQRKQQKHKGRRAPVTGGDDDPEADGDALRERLREAATRASELEEEVKRLRAQAARDEGRSTRARAAPVGDAAEVPRLREKVDELKALLAESQEERRELRRELEAARARDDDERAKAAASAAGKAEPERRDDDDEEGPAAEAPDERRPALVPVFSDAAAAAVRDADRALGRAALRIVSGVAGGDPQVWAQVKRLRRRTDVCSARVGIHHRLLFRLHPTRGELEVMSFINRRELDATIRRLG